jgi:hypothetical protein
LRNPWGVDEFNGTWSDSDTTHWNASTEAQVNYVDNANDGVFYISCNDVVNYYDEIQVGFFIDSYVNNYLEALTVPASTTYTYTFTIASTAVTWAGIDFYNTRMSPYGCRSEGSTYALV